MISNIVLTGYYGFGNLGDDLLCICTMRIARKLFPAAEVSIFTWSRDPGYLCQLLGETVGIHSGAMPPADLIIHGGGGVFFDFKTGSASTGWANSFIKAIGVRRYAMAVKWYNRRIRKRTNNPIRVGLGLGVGLYTRSSRRFFSDVLVMADFSYIMVRDIESRKNLSLLGIRNARVGTDLAFGYDFSRICNDSREANEVAFILRDWNYDNTYLTHWLAIAQKLYGAGYQVKIFSFDRDADREYLTLFSAFEQAIWNPRQTADLPEFLQQLRRARVVVSSRAHGVIAAAGLGIPSFCIEIEPKLRTIASMLPESATLVDAKTDSDSAISGIMRVYQSARPHTPRADVIRNRQILEAAVAQVGNFLTASKLRR